MRGETDDFNADTQEIEISIHSPHARGDPRGAAGNSVYAYFNPLPSCEGRRATDTATNYLPDDFNPLPSCEGRRRCGGRAPIPVYISIHSPHARGDVIARIQKRGHTHFNPLPSCEGRPLRAAKRFSRASISIHSPHARGDDRLILLCM